MSRKSDLIAKRKEWWERVLPPSLAEFQATDEINRSIVRDIARGNPQVKIAKYMEVSSTRISQIDIHAERIRKQEGGVLTIVQRYFQNPWNAKASKAIKYRYRKLEKGGEDE